MKRPSERLIEQYLEGEMFVMTVPVNDKDKAAAVMKKGGVRCKPLPDAGNKAQFGFTGSDPEAKMATARRLLKTAGIEAQN